MNSLRNSARMLAREIRSSTPAGPIQTLAIRHVEDALMRANKAIVENARETAEQSWTVYFDLEDSESYVIGDEAFEGNPGRARVMESASPHMIRYTKQVAAFRK